MSRSRCSLHKPPCATGVFYFPRSAFSVLPLDLICVGTNHNMSVRMDGVDLDVSPLVLR